MNVATQTQSTQYSENNYNLRENSVLVALGAQRQIISKGCDDSVLCSYRFEALLFSKREKWMEFVFEAELNTSGRRTEASINFIKDYNSKTSPMFQMKNKKEFMGGPVNMNWEVDPSSYSAQPHDNLTIESDQEDEIGLGAEELLQPSTKMEVGVLRDLGEKIVYMELLDPLPELDVDVGRLGSKLQDESTMKGKAILDPLLDIGWKDSLLGNEGWEDEKYCCPPRNIESNLESVLIKIEGDIEIKGNATQLNLNENQPTIRKRNLKRASPDSTTKDELSRTFRENKYPFLKECFVSVAGLPRELTATDVPKCASANKASKLSEEIKGNIKSISRSTRKRPKNRCSINNTSSCSKRTRLTLEPSVKVNVKVESQSFYEDCEDDIDSVHKHKSIHYNKCDKIFTLKKGLNKHILSAGKNVEPFKCCSCNDVFSDKKTLAKHILSVHKHLNQHKCPICDLGFDLKKTLFIHIKTVHKKLKQSKCPYCNYESSLRKLTVHLKSVHAKLKPFKCLECNLSYSHKGNLAFHMKSVHEKMKSFKCLDCNYSSSHKGRLSTHTKSVHEKIKPYKCFECNHSFSQKGNLIIHMKTVHEKIKPFKCLKCNCSFTRKADLLRHLKFVH